MSELMNEDLQAEPEAEILSESEEEFLSGPEAETQPEVPAAPVKTPNAEPRPVRKRRKSRKKNRFAFRLPAFLSTIGEDVRWYYDIRLWSPLILILLVLVGCVGRTPREKAPEAVPSTGVEVIETVPETPPATEAAPLDPEAVALARLAESVGAGRTDNVKTIIMWVAINRMEDRANGYGMSLIEEINRPSQWQGYDENIPYTEGIYEIAVDVLETVRTGGLRPLDPGMLWFVLNNDGSITVRNQFTARAGQTWIEKTVK